MPLGGVDGGGHGGGGRSGRGTTFGEHDPVLLERFTMCFWEMLHGNMRSELRAEPPMVVRRRVRGLASRGVPRGHVEPIRQARPVRKVSFGCPKVGPREFVACFLQESREASVANPPLFVVKGLDDVGPFEDRS